MATTSEAEAKNPRARRPKASTGARGARTASGAPLGETREIRAATGGALTATRPARGRGRCVRRRGSRFAPTRRNSSEARVGNACDESSRTPLRDEITRARSTARDGAIRVRENVSFSRTSRRRRETTSPSTPTVPPRASSPRFNYPSRGDHRSLSRARSQPTIHMPTSLPISRRSRGARVTCTLVLYYRRRRTHRILARGVSLLSPIRRGMSENRSRSIIISYYTHSHSAPTPRTRRGSQSVHSSLRART